MNLKKFYEQSIKDRSKIISIPGEGNYQWCQALRVATNFQHLFPAKKPHYVNQEGERCLVIGPLGRFELHCAYIIEW